MHQLTHTAQNENALTHFYAPTCRLLSAPFRRGVDLSRKRIIYPRWIRTGWTRKAYAYMEL